MLNKNLIKFIMSISLFLFSSNSMAADETIEMLNKLGKESMVYSKKVVKVDIGDTVYWKSTNPGHNVEFIKGGVPEGVEKFKTKFRKMHSILLKFQVSMPTGVHLIKAWE